jgi:hypothetical protein
MSRKESQDAFRKIKPRIDKSYPLGWFVALDGDQIIADAPTLEKLTGILLQMGRRPQETFMVQAGAEYPEKAVIFGVDLPWTTSSNATAIKVSHLDRGFGSG